MKLTDAYERLGWGDPLDHEESALCDVPNVPNFTRIGTTGHMLVELYLDMHESHDVQKGFVDFIVVCKGASHGRQMRRWLEHVHEKLDLAVDLNRVTFWGYESDAKRLKGTSFYSWAIFCDHGVRDLDKHHDNRNRGLYGLIRQFVPNEGLFEAYDRDNEKLGLLTEGGKKEVLDNATCPITVEGMLPTTWPPLEKSSNLNPLVRLKRRFER